MIRTRRNLIYLIIRKECTCCGILVLPDVVVVFFFYSTGQDDSVHWLAMIVKNFCLIKRSCGEKNYRKKQKQQHCDICCCSSHSMKRYKITSE